MFDEHRLGNDGTNTARPCEPDDGDDQMDEKNDDIAPPGRVSNPKKHLSLAQFGNSPWTGKQVGPSVAQKTEFLRSDSQAKTGTESQIWHTRSTQTSSPQFRSDLTGRKQSTIYSYSDSSR